jgi:cytochrome c oxidase subunit 4
MSATTAHAEHAEHHVTPKTYLMVYCALMGLMFLTLAAAFFDLGPANFALAMVIAFAKMALIILFFMHVRYSDKLTWVFSIAAIFWFLIFVFLTLNDYLTRGFFGVPGK